MGQRTDRSCHASSAATMLVCVDYPSIRHPCPCAHPSVCLGMVGLFHYRTSKQASARPVPHDSTLPPPCAQPAVLPPLCLFLAVTAPYCPVPTALNLHPPPVCRPCLTLTGPWMLMSAPSSTSTAPGLSTREPGATLACGAAEGGAGVPVRGLPGLAPDDKVFRARNEPPRVTRPALPTGSHSPAPPPSPAHTP